jgi:DtxR family Mn-dependent transcriptional regulator
MVSTSTSQTQCTPAIEDYLKAIYALQRDHGVAQTSAIGERLGGVKPGSVTGMLYRLVEQGLVEHRPYYGVHLTDAGERAVLALLRTHRLIETYLVAALGYGWDEVHAEAEQLEHHISPRLVERMAAQLGHPVADPHGAPIPLPDGSLPNQPCRCLCELVPGEQATVVRVIEQHPERLRYLASLGLVPGADIMLKHAAPFDGPLTVQVGPHTHALDRRLAAAIAVATTCSAQE